MKTQSSIFLCGTTLFIVSLSIIEKKKDNSSKVFFLAKEMLYSFLMSNCGRVPISRMNTFILLPHVDI